MNFDSVQDFVTALIRNEGQILADGYGREWSYNDYDFTFKDIGENEVHELGLKCLHLWSSPIRIKTEK